MYTADLAKLRLLSSNYCTLTDKEPELKKMLSNSYDLPDHFDDKTVVDALKSSFLSDSLLWPFNQNEERTLIVTSKSRKSYPVICGLLLRLRTAMFRVAKRSKMREVSAEDTYEDRLFRLMKCFISSDCDSDFVNKWTPVTLSIAGTELARKNIFLSSKLQKELNDQPLQPLNKGESSDDGGQLQLNKVIIYLRTLITQRV